MRLAPFTAALPRQRQESIEAARRKDKTRMQENARLRRALVGLEEEIERLQNELGLKDKSEAQLRSEVRWCWHERPLGHGRC